MKIAFDIDGTLSNNDHREHLAVAKKWDEFHSLAHLDPPISPTVAVLQSLVAARHTVEIWTARPDTYRDHTWAWLNHNLGSSSALLGELKMRRAGDWRKAYIVKLEWYLLSGVKPALVFEDHPETIRLLRAAGATVYAVNEGRQG